MLLEKIYARPYRVYLCFFLLVITGIICYYSMPVALFPNSAKPEVYVNIPYDTYTKDEFLNTYGKSIEASLKRLRSTACVVDQVIAQYENNAVEMFVTFSWGNDAITCLKEIDQAVLEYKGRWSDNMRYGTNVWLNSKSIGYFLGSFYSDKRSAQEVHDILDPLIYAKLQSISEVNETELYNPNKTQIVITLDPLKMATFKLLPATVATTIKNAIKSYSGGVLHNAAKTIIVEVAPQVGTVEQLREILVPTANNQAIALAEIADIALKENVAVAQVSKINGNPAVILYVAPAPGKNIKSMCDQVLTIVHDVLQSDAIPKDIKFTSIIDPGSFIKDSITNVMREVWLCSFIAVVVLFIFIGSFSGTLTALMEIPISIILSFILMKLTNIQINLISLGGLALSVGMNVDASVVVIDSIIKRLKGSTIPKHEVVPQVALAVREVFTPIILATITSLIVFIPLIFTSELTYAILGDLAKTVIYSHGLSLFIALLLVPTIRIHLATAMGMFADQHRFAKIDLWLNKLYAFYSTSLTSFLTRKKLRHITYALVTASIVLVFLLVPPRLTREIVSPPDTDIIVTGIFFPGSSHISQIGEKIAEHEQLVQGKYGKDVAYFFSRVWQVNNGMTATILQDKSKFKKMFENLQELTKGSTDIHYYVHPYNPSELPIPNPPDWRIEFASSDVAAANKVKEWFYRDLLEIGIVEDINYFTSDNSKYLVKPFIELFQKMQKLNVQLKPADLGQMLSLTNTPMRLDKLTINDKDKDIVLMYPEHAFTTDSDFKSLPVSVGDKVVPVRALAEFESVGSDESLRRIDNENSFRIEGKLTEKEKQRGERKILAELKKFTENFKANTLKNVSNKVTVNMVDAKVELTKAINELMTTTLLSLVLIFLVLYLRFASIIHTLIIMLAIPFGILGVFLSLWVFNSTLSLNSALGIILLNGITVANSIMLVDKILKNIDQGLAPMDAILLTAKARIRPILMTSIITILGMLPIAMGFGEGGKVLQPLGIAVSGGLWVSLIFTLYIIPALELKVLTKK